MPVGERGDEPVNVAPIQFRMEVKIRRNSPLRLRNPLFGSMSIARVRQRASSSQVISLLRRQYIQEAVVMVPATDSWSNAMSATVLPSLPVVRVTLQC